jgi:hypothetical protein
MEEDISRSKAKERLPIEAARLCPLRGYPAANKKLRNIRLVQSPLSYVCLSDVNFHVAIKVRYVPKELTPWK